MKTELLRELILDIESIKYYTNQFDINTNQIMLFEESIKKIERIEEELNILFESTKSKKRYFLVSYVWQSEKWIATWSTTYVSDWFINWMDFSKYMGNSFEIFNVSLQNLTEVTEEEYNIFNS